MTTREKRLANAVKRTWSRAALSIRGGEGYWRNVSTLMFGSFGAQIIGVLSMLAVARIYGPAEMGLFAFFFAVAGLLTMLGTGRYELAIYVARTEREASETALLTVALSATCAGVLALAAPAAGPLLQRIDATNELGRVFGFLPFAVVTGGTVAALSAMATRRKAFNLVAKARILQAATVAATNIALGLIGAGASGMMVGFICGQALFVLFLGARFLPRRRLHPFRWRNLAVRARRNSKFPRFLIFGETFSFFGANLVALLTPAHFGAAVLGQYNLGQRVAGLPMTALGSAMGEVFRSAIGPQHAKPAEVARVFRATALRLAGVGALLTLPLLLAAPFLFELMFGEKWRQAGVYVQILSPMTFARFVVNPLSAILHLRGRQKLDTILQVLFVASALIAIFIGSSLESFTAMVVAFSVLHTAIYGVYFLLSYRIAMVTLISP